MENKKQKLAFAATMAVLLNVSVRELVDAQCVFMDDFKQEEGRV